MLFSLQLIVDRGQAGNLEDFVVADADLPVVLVHHQGREGWQSLLTALLDDDPEDSADPVSRLCSGKARSAAGSRRPTRST